MAVHRLTPGSQVGSSASHTYTLHREWLFGTAGAYTRSAAARPPGREAGKRIGADHTGSPISLTRILAVVVMQIDRGGSGHVQQARLTIFCTQVS
jgi:hypothetical protein